MRGVYASSQQKMLVMLNGHRLNSRAYSSANPDYGISLEKIKQIEIIRGPGSSLYGNVALAGVVSIITKSGNDINGTEVKLGTGNYGQTYASVLHGIQMDKKKDFVFWGSLYRASGEKYEVDAADDYAQIPHSGNAILGGIKDKPAINLGFNYNYQKFSIMANYAMCKTVEPFSAGGTNGEVYNYDDYRTFFGTGPGLGYQSENLSFAYGDEFNSGFHYSVKMYADYNAIDGLLIIRPSDTTAAALEWREYDYGTEIQTGHKYDIGAAGKGDVIVGTQIDAMTLYDSFYPMGHGGELLTVNDRKNTLLLEQGSEEIYSGFAQIKHFFTEKIIANLGFRYDSKNRHRGEPVSDFSPRLAIIWKPEKIVDIKASYSKSFVDAPYWYRYNTIASYKGSSGLLPEHLTSYQLNIGFHFLYDQLTYQLNTFRNELIDIIYRDGAATGDEPRYKNAGFLKNYGIENEIRYITKPLGVFANFTWLYVDTAKDYVVTDKHVNNVPSIFGNFAVNYFPLYKTNNKLIINFTMRYIGEQYSPIRSGYKGGVAFADIENKVDAALLFNAAITLRNIYGLTIQFQGTNLADKKYSQGGSVRFPYPQPGRWYSINLSYKF